MIGLPYGEEIMIVGRTMWTQCTSVTDGRTDRRTDRITITKTVERRASHLTRNGEIGDVEDKSTGMSLGSRHNGIWALPD